MADVELGEGDLEAKGSEALERSGNAAAARGAADNKMALEADTVDGGASSLNDLDQLDGLVGLGAVVLQVVVVVVPGQLAGRGLEMADVVGGSPYSLTLESAALARLNARGK